MQFKEFNLSIVTDREELAKVLLDNKLEISAHTISAHGQMLKISMVNVPEQPSIRTVSELNRVV